MKALVLKEIKNLEIADIDIKESVGPNDVRIKIIRWVFAAAMSITIRTAESGLSS